MPRCSRRGVGPWPLAAVRRRPWASDVGAILAAMGDSLERSAPDLEASLADLRRSLAAVARHADSIAFDVESASRNLNEFSEQVRRDPSVLLRGREDGEEPEVQ